MAQQIIVLGPGVYSVTVPTRVFVTAHLYGAGGGGGGVNAGDPSFSSGYGSGGGYTYVNEFILDTISTLTIAVGEGGNGGGSVTLRRPDVIPDVTPRSLIGTLGGRSLMGFAGGPGGAVSNVNLNKVAGLGGGGGGATVLSLGTLVKIAGGGGGGGGGVGSITVVGTEPTSDVVIVVGGLTSDPGGANDIYGIAGVSDNTAQQLNAVTFEAINVTGSGGGGGGVDGRGGRAGFHNAPSYPPAAGHSGTSGTAGVLGSTFHGARPTVPPISLPPAYTGDGGAGGSRQGYGGGNGCAILILRTVPSIITTPGPTTAPVANGSAIKDGGAWKSMMKVSHKSGGVWSSISKIFVKHNGQWRNAYNIPVPGVGTPITTTLDPPVGAIVTDMPAFFVRLQPSNVLTPTVVPPVVPTGTPIIEVRQVMGGSAPAHLQYNIVDTVTSSIPEAFYIKNIGTGTLVVTGINPVINRVNQPNPITGTNIVMDSVRVAGTSTIIGGSGADIRLVPNTGVYFSVNLLSRAGSNGNGTGNNHPSNNPAPFPPSYVEFTSNDPVTSTLSVPITVVVAGAPPVVTVVTDGTTVYTDVGSHTFVPRAGVTTVLVVIQGAGAHGTAGGSANNAPGRVDTGRGGGSGEFKIVRRTVIPGVTYTVVVGAVGGALTRFGDDASALGGTIPTTPSIQVGDSTNRGGDGGGAYRYTLPASDVSGGGVGGYSSLTNPTGGANGGSATAAGAGGGGGGLDNGTRAGIGGIGMPGYVRVHWGSHAVPVEAAMNHLASTPSIITQTAGTSGNYYEFPLGSGVKGELAGHLFGTRQNTVIFPATIKVKNVLATSTYLSTNWNDVSLVITGSTNCEFSLNGSTGWTSSITVGVNTILAGAEAAVPLHVRSTGIGEASFGIKASGFITGVTAPWETQPTNFRATYNVTAFMSTTAGVDGQLSGHNFGSTPNRVLNEIFPVTVTVNNVSNSLYAPTTWKTVNLVVSNGDKCEFSLNGMSGWATNITVTGGDITVGGSGTRVLYVRSTAPGEASYQIKASGFVDGVMAAWETQPPGHIERYTVNKPLGVDGQIIGSDFDDIPAALRQTSRTFTAAITIKNVANTYYTPSTWKNVKLKLSGGTNCVFSQVGSTTTTTDIEVNFDNIFYNSMATRSVNVTSLSGIMDTTNDPHASLHTHTASYTVQATGQVDEITAAWETAPTVTTYTATDYTINGVNGQVYNSDFDDHNLDTVKTEDLPFNVTMRVANDTDIHYNPTTWKSVVLVFSELVNCDIEVTNQGPHNILYNTYKDFMVTVTPKFGTQMVDDSFYSASYQIKASGFIDGVTDAWETQPDTLTHTFAFAPKPTA